MDKTTNVSQILHTFHGKRTPSMFYLIEVNQWHHGFRIYPNIKIEQLQKNLNELLRLQWLEGQGKGYRLTKIGAEKRKQYFESHYFPFEINSFANQLIRKPFWDSYQLFTQVFSEMSYQNNRYAPIIRHPRHQENVRLLFQQFKTKREELLNKWISEQQILFNLLEDEMADILVNQLSGHNRIGNTRKQTQEITKMNNLEYEFYHRSSLEKMIQEIKKHQDKLQILSVILKLLNKETHYGLSSSTFQTYQLLIEGRSLTEIANIRSLKENTIREHILEMAFVLDDFQYNQFIPNHIKDTLEQYFEQYDIFTYKDAVSKNKQIEFMHYRLVELERMRKK